MVKIRNGFDHAWTSEKAAFTEIEDKGKQYLKKLQEIVGLMSEKQLFSKEENA